MEFGSPDFWVALMQIIGINIVLSGDNAVVIALACRSLPPEQQKKAIFWGQLRGDRDARGAHRGCG
jgi:predicted tellurium resistance membrane protein TerC